MHRPPADAAARFRDVDVVEDDIGERVVGSQKGEQIDQRSEQRHGPAVCDADDSQVDAIHPAGGVDAPGVAWRAGQLESEFDVIPDARLDQGVVKAGAGTAESARGHTARYLRPKDPHAAVLHHAQLHRVPAAGSRKLAIENHVAHVRIAGVAAAPIHSESDQDLAHREIRQLVAQRPVLGQLDPLAVASSDRESFKRGRGPLLDQFGFGVVVVERIRENEREIGHYSEICTPKSCELKLDTVQADPLALVSNGIRQ